MASREIQASAFSITKIPTNVSKATTLHLIGQPTSLCRSRCRDLNICFTISIYAIMPVASRQKYPLVSELFPQVPVDDVVEAMLGERLLLGAHPHLQELLHRGHPLPVMLEERVVLDRIVRPLDVDLLERMRRQLVIDDVLGGDPEERRLRDAE